MRKAVEGRGYGCGAPSACFLKLRARRPVGGDGGKFLDAASVEFIDAEPGSSRFHANVWIGVNA
jgi:hypothetical protein